MAFNFLRNLFRETRDTITDEAQKLISKIAVNKLAYKTPPRPRPYSLWSEVPKPEGPENQGPITDYTSWPSLTDRSFSGRHLPPCSQAHVDQLPAETPYQNPNDVGDITSLFKRREQINSTRNTLTFPFFAQWFTDSILRIDPTDRRKNTSNHEIDLCQIYGLKESTANLLRSKVDGKLASQMINGQEYPEYLYEQNGSGEYHVAARFAELPYVTDGRINAITQRFPEDRKAKFFATGLERGNSTIGYTAMSTLFLREHNRLCANLKQRNPSWGDEQLFQTARMINIVLLLKIVVEDYICHIAGGVIPFKLDNSFPEEETWYRTNWINIEFDLLYRWHSLIPDNIILNNEPVSGADFMMNNELLINLGVGELLQQASNQPSGKIGLGNTPDFLLEAEYQSIKMSRDFRLQGYNDYRERFDLDRLESLDELTADPILQARLAALYGDIDNVEFFVGLFAEDADSPAIFGELLTAMVATDAFTQALTNPLLSLNIFNDTTFTAYGMQVIEETTRLQDLVKRNVAGGDGLEVTMTLSDT
jgi:prostaglandin-endoperoxide synthase 2